MTLERDVEGATRPDTASDTASGDAADPRAEHSGEAVTRILRLITGAYGAGSLVFGALAWSSIVEQSPLINPVWTWFSIVVMFGGGLGIGIAARWASATVMRRAMAVIAIAYLVSLATLLPALTSGTLSSTHGSPWILGITALGTTAAALAWTPIRGVGLYVLLVAIAVGVNRAVAASEPAIYPVAVEDAVWGFCYDAIFAALALVSVRAGAKLDRAADSARAKVLETAGTLARSQERARAEALVHDGVLATLLAASRDSPSDQRAATTHAKRTLELLDEFRSGPSSRGLTPLSFIWKLQALTTETASEAEFTYDLENEQEIPADVARAMTEATGEALRNSIHHADAPDRLAARAVHVRIIQSGIAIAILDDGRGFDLADVSPTRMGIAISIRARMSRLDHGSARIASEPGLGTRVLLEWKPSS